MPETAERTVLAFDFGLKRIGVAVGEPLTRTSHPLPAVAAAGAVRFAAIDKLIAEWRPGLLVVGLPLAADGTRHAMTRQAERFAHALASRFRIKVTQVDERFTSVEARSKLRGMRGAKRALDSVAAQLILEQFFDERRAA